MTEEQNYEATTKSITYIPVLGHRHLQNQEVSQKLGQLHDQ